MLAAFTLGTVDRVVAAALRARIALAWAGATLIALSLLGML
jgi:hypothetical protein